MPRKRKKSRLWIVLILIVGGAFLAYSYLTPEAQEVSYMTQEVSFGNIRRIVNTTGQINAIQLVDVGAQVSGQIVSLSVQLGDTVSRGDLIAEIDNTSQINELGTSKARLETYQAQLESRRTALAVAQAAYDRELQLRRSDSTSRTNLENAENTLAQAIAAVTELESSITQTQIAVSDAETNLSRTRITAPLDGTIVAVLVEQGQTLNANTSSPTIVMIADLSSMEIRVEISEGDITKVEPGMTVEYSILSDPNTIFTTTLASIDPALNSMSDGTFSSSNSGTNAVYYYGKCIVDNSDRLLRIGMTTTNTIIVDTAENVLIVPNIAINSIQGRNVVQVLHINNEVEAREIEIGVADAMNTHVISGLNPGDKVITTRMDRNAINAQARGGMVRMGGPGR